MADADTPTLRLVSYFDGPRTKPGWPKVEEFIDPKWDKSDRYVVAQHVARGFVARAYMGHSMCRLCGRVNGTLELTDGVFTWPEGFVHYIKDHGVRPPAFFVENVLQFVERTEHAEHDTREWLGSTNSQ